jgi:hypothetical protein
VAKQAAYQARLHKYKHIASSKELAVLAGLPFSTPVLASNSNAGAPPAAVYF